MEMKALLIEWDPSTGKRAGNINPRDPALRCDGWQNMDVVPAIELRIVEDDRDMTQYENIKGVTILRGKNEINNAISTNFKSKYIVNDDLIYSEHVKSMRGKIDISKLPDDKNERLKVLKSIHGIKGITEIKPKMV